MARHGFSFLYPTMLYRIRAHFSDDVIRVSRIVENPLAREICLLLILFNSSI